MDKKSFKNATCGLWQGCERCEGGGGGGGVYGLDFIRYQLRTLLLSALHIYTSIRNNGDTYAYCVCFVRRSSWCHFALPSHPFIPLPHLFSGFSAITRPPPISFFSQIRSSHRCRRRNSLYPPALTVVRFPRLPCDFLAASSCWLGRAQRQLSHSIAAGQVCFVWHSRAV